MYDDNDWHVNETVVNLQFRERLNGDDRDIHFHITKNVEYYPALLDHFKMFLNAIGFSYIDSIRAYDEHGKELKSSYDA